MSKIKTKANEGSTVVPVKTGLARHRQILAEAWKSERHPPTAGTARQGSGKRKRS